MTNVAFVLLFGWAAGIAQAQSPAEVATILASRISSQLQRHPTVSLELESLSSMTPADLSSLRNALGQELRKAGLLMTATQPEARVRVTVSNNARGVLMVAELLSGDSRTVLMQPWTAPPSNESKPRLRIVSKPILDQAEPILDLLLNSESDLLVLSPTSVTSLHLNGGRWTSNGVAAFSPLTPIPRDVRGRIEGAPGGFSIYLPGTTCSGTFQPVLRVVCSPPNELWPVNPREPSFVARWTKDRNTLESEGFAGGFYTEAAGWISTPNHRITDRTGDLLDLPEPWGSDFTSIASPCEANPTVLVSGSGDNPDHDQIVAYEIRSSHATLASEPLGVPGPITALWPAETPGQATLVTRNSKTGNYEASRLGMACAE
jgi:hypothetical protein